MTSEIPSIWPFADADACLLFETHTRTPEPTINRMNTIKRSGRIAF